MQFSDYTFHRSLYTYVKYNFCLMLNIFPKWSKMHFEQKTRSTTTKIIISLSNDTLFLIVCFFNIFIRLYLIDHVYKAANSYWILSDPAVQPLHMMAPHTRQALILVYSFIICVMFKIHFSYINAGLLIEIWSEQGDPKINTTLWVNPIFLIFVSLISLFKCI
jgi:hypothetical protein